MKLVRVAVIYEPERKPRPVWFDLEGEQVKVQEVTYFWEYHEGSALIKQYSVQTEKGLFELKFNTLAQTWELKQ